MNKAVFLDRDGVLNRTIFRDGKETAPYSLEEFELFPGMGEDDCLCRKPMPGMLLEAAIEWNIDLKRSLLVVRPF